MASRKITKGKNNQKTKQHRVYHRVSTFTPDQQAFISYLMQRGYGSTLKVFQEELQQKQKIIYSNQLMSLIDSQEEVSLEVFRSWVEEIKKSFYGQSNQLVKLEFMLTVWLCSLKKQKIPKEHLKILRNFIEKNGVKLSQFPETLPYFALPYIQEPASHPFLSKIYTKQWKEELKQMISNYCRSELGNNLQMQLQINKDSQWLTIIKDLLQICVYFDSECSSKSEKHREMLERVKKYQKVIEDNDGSIFIQGQSIKPSELSRLVFKTERDNPQIKISQSQQSIGEMSSVHEYIYQSLSFPPLKAHIRKILSEKQKDNKQLCLIFYALQSRIQETLNSYAKKQMILKYIENDILFLHQKQQFTELFKQIQCLKLINTMCATSTGIKYISHSQSCINELCKIIIHNKLHFTDPKHHKVLDAQSLQAIEERLIQTFGILQKISFNKDAYIKIMKTELPSTLVIGYLINYEILPTSVLTYVLALVLNLTLKREGKLLISSMRCPQPKTHSSSKQNPITFFELMIKVWKYVLKSLDSAFKQPIQFQQKEGEPQSQIQSLIYSIFYILLSIEQNKKIAKSINFKQMLNKFVEQKNDEYHIKISKYMVEVMQSNENTQEQQQNDDEEMEDQFDEDDLRSFSQYKGCVWVDDKLVNMGEKEQFNSEKMLERFYESAQPVAKPSENNINKEKETIQQNQQKNKNNENLFSNLSTPNFVEIGSTQKKEKLKESKMNQPINKNASVHLTTFDKVQGYDPSKYQAWRKLKTAKTQS